MSNEHKLVNDTLTRDEAGITARCTCGWVSAGHFSSMGASAALREHQELAERMRVSRNMKGAA